MAPPKNPPRLVYSWGGGIQGKYRVITKSDHMPGYRDRILIERCETDALGGERWLLEREWRPEAGYSDDPNREPLLTALIDGLESAIKERDEAFSSAYKQGYDARTREEH